jgi:hypothetical protein
VALDVLPHAYVEKPRERIERLGIPFDALPDLLETTESAIRKWVAGMLTVEESDVIEVAVSMLEVRIARVVERRDDVTARMTALA